MSEKLGDRQQEPPQQGANGNSSSMDELLAASAGVDERNLVRKLDLHLVPLIMGLYLFSFLDR